MARPDLNVPLVPAYDVLIDGTSFAVSFAGDLRRITVEDDLALPAMFSVELAGSDDGKGELPWLDDKAVTIGGRVEVKLGYAGSIDSVIKGSIAALEPEFVAGRPPVLRLRGYDARQSLQRGTRTRSFVNSKDSDIASKIGQDAGLTVDATDSEIVHDYVLQANQTDMEFLLDRAAEIEFEMLLRDGKLLFRPAGFGAGDELTLNVNEDLLEFSASFSVAQQVSLVEPRAWSVKDKHALTAKAEAGAEKTVMGDKTSAKWVEQAFQNGTTARGFAMAASTQAEVDTAAKARFNDMSLALVTAEGATLGRTDLRTGSVVKITGAGKRFSGPYYVVSVQHQFTPRAGYLTRFAARRNAV